MPRRVVLGAVIAFAAVAVLALVAYRQNQELYFGVAELAASPAELRSTYPAVALLAGEVPDGQSRRLRVRGRLLEAHLRESAQGPLWELVLAEDRHRLAVLYRGPTPDALATAEQVTAAGWLAADGMLVADQLTVQCPSKYEPQEKAASSSRDPTVSDRDSERQP